MKGSGAIGGAVGVSDVMGMIVVLVRVSCLPASFSVCVYGLVGVVVRPCMRLVM